MGEAKNAVPPYTWSGTRPGIIITANLLPSMLGAGMHGNVEGSAALENAMGRHSPRTDSVQWVQNWVNIGEVGL